MEFPSELLNLIIRFGFNLLIAYTIIKVIYKRNNRNNLDFVFTYFMFNSLIFFFAFLLSKITINMGFAFGMFAVFAILRYRTDPIPIKEMTYLFLVIGISVLNALANKKISHSELIFANFMIVFVTFGLEKIWLLRHESRKNIVYEKIELILPERREELIEDLRLRTGIDIVRIEIRNVDFLRDVANIRIFYYDKDSR